MSRDVASSSINKSPCINHIVLRSEVRGRVNPDQKLRAIASVIATEFPKSRLCEARGGFLSSGRENWGIFRHEIASCRLRIEAILRKEEDSIR